MTDWLSLAAGVMGLTAVCLYLVWWRVRKSFIRQRLFAVRDRLWGEALEGGFLDDPAYCEFREYVNATIVVIPHLSLPVVLYLSKRMKFETPERRNYDAKSLAAFNAIESARLEISDLIRRYVLYWHPFSGFMLQNVLKFGLNLGSRFEKLFRRRKKSADPLFPDDLDEYYQLEEDGWQRPEGFHYTSDTPSYPHTRFSLDDNRFFERLVKTGKVDDWWEDSASHRSHELRDAFNDENSVEDCNTEEHAPTG